MPAQGALVSFVSTNSIGQPDTNILKAIPVTGPTAFADGSFGSIGVPIRIYPDANGRATNLLMQNNYQITNAYQNYYIRVPLDSGNTVYPSGQLLISGNYGNANVFVTVTNGPGGTNLPTYNQVTNIFGGAPILQTNLPSLTNGFITLLEATNVSKTSTFNASNSLYLDYTTRIAVLSALSMTNAFATNAAGILLVNHQLFISTNYDALGTALAIGVTASNYTFAVSNALALQIGAAGVSAATATNIAAFQAQKVTNGFIGLLDATNVFNGKILAPSNTLAGLSATVGLQATNFTIAVSNALAGQIGSAGISSLTATNISTNQVFLGTNAIGIASGASAFVSTNRFDTNGAAAMKANTNNATLFTPKIIGGTVTNIGAFEETTAVGSFVKFRDEPDSDSSNDRFSMKVNGTDGGVYQWWDGVQGQMLLYSFDNQNSFFMDGAGDVYINGNITLNAGGVVTAYDIGNGLKISGSGGGVTLGAGAFTGDGSGLTNLQIAGLSTNGSAALQVPTSIGGVVKFTNVTSILGTAYTNGFIAPPDLQASLGSGTNTYTGRFSNLTNTGPLVFGNFGSVFQESLLGGNWTLNLTPHSNGTFKVNGNFLVGSNITGNLFIGDGSGLTNTTSTNLALGALAQVTNIASSLASSGINASTGTNIAAFQIGLSNAFLFGNKLNRTNDTSYGQVATNFAIEGNVAFGRDGQATNIISSTNFLYFVNAGSGIVTNGAFVWVNAMASYTNWLTGASMTNNGSAWLLQTNGVTLYSLAGTSPIGTYAAVNGALPAPTAFYTAAINDHMVMLGYFSVSNLQQQFASAGASNAIANLNGFGTNAFLTWSGVSTQNFFTAQFGISNVTASPYSVILGGTRNWISNFQDAAVIVGGISNTIVGFTEISPYSAIYGGLQNSINQSRQTAIFNGQSDLIDSGSEMSQILGGLGNSIGTSGGSNRGNQSTILGGSGNKIIGTVNEPLLFNGLILQGVNDIVSSSFGVAIGRNISLTNASSSLVFSDGTPVTTQTNSSVIFMATNGVGINTNYPAGFALNVNGAINATSISVSKAPVVVNASTIPFTNSSAAGILSTNLGDAANTNLVYSDVNGGMHRASIGSGLSWSATTATLSASGGGGSQTPLAGDVDGAGFGLTNLALEKITNTLSVGGQATVSALIVTNGVTNLATLKVMGNQSNAGTFSVTGNATNFAGAYFPLLTASTLLELDSTKKAASIANPSVAGSYILTNDNNGNMGWAGSLNGSALGAAQFVKTDANTNLVSSLDATGLTNTVPYTNFLTTTNIAIVFDGNMHMGTVTNGPDVWITPSVSGSGSGSWSFEFTTNVNIHLPIPVRWVAGSNGVSANVFAITNGEFDLTAYGGTNYPHLKAAIGENQ